MKRTTRRSKQTIISESVDTTNGYQKRIRDLELENEGFKREIEELSKNLTNLSFTSDASMRKLKEDHFQRSSSSHKQVLELKRRSSMQSQLSTQKSKTEGAPQQLQEETQKLKAQKVQLQCKMKIDSVQFRLSKTSLEREILQLKKEQRRDKFEMRILLALNKQQKLVLKRKTEETLVAIKRLKQLMELKKVSSRKAGPGNGSSCATQVMQAEDINNALEVSTKFQRLHSQYECQMKQMAEEINSIKRGAEILKEDDSRCMLEENEVEFGLMSSELKDLKEEVSRLTNLVNQIETPKSQLNVSSSTAVIDDQVHPVQFCISVENNINSLDMDSLSSKETITPADKTTTQVCCSCSKKSLCKTSKCGCRTAGSGCGTSCGCAVSKCTNREVSIESDSSMQSEKNVNVELNIVGKENGSVSISEDTAQNEKLLNKNHNGRLRKQPLHDTANKQIKSVAVKGGGKKKTEKVVTEVGFGVI